MRFEVFDGPRSIATLSLRSDGRIAVRARDPEDRDRLLADLGVEAEGDPEGEEAVSTETFDPVAFEMRCRDLAQGPRLSVAPRPADALD